MAKVPATAKVAAPAAAPATPAKEVGVVADIKMIKADDLTQGGTRTAVRSRGWEYEDEFAGKYGPAISGQPGDVQIIEPPYLPRTLEALCQQNNTLSVCVTAFVTNVHGTGFDVVPKDEADAEAPEIEQLTAFFDETYPGESFRELRKQVGKDLERVGNAYIEVIRNLQKQIIFLRRLDPKLMRVVKKDEPVAVDVSVQRGGAEFTAKVMMRYRRFVQTINGTKMLYFKEYGCPRVINADTGKWDDATPIDNMGSEILYLTREDDSLTPYGVPVWIPQIPSVLGSRKAEEHNLTFFDHGGVPPIMVFVNGGALTPLAAQALREHLQGGANKHQIPVIETVSTSGSIDSPGQVRVTVERFGAERQDDSMFEGYDERCEKRVRRAWRLPPLFVGATEDFNFATAFASYLVTEAQVFLPERQEFDDLINRTVMKELDPSGRFEFRSRPITIKDIDKQLMAIQIAIQGQVIGRQQLVDLLNQMTDLGLRLDEDDLVGAMGGGFGVDPVTGEPLGPDGMPLSGDPNADPNAIDPAAGSTEGGDPALKAQKFVKASLRRFALQKQALDRRALVRGSTGRGGADVAALAAKTYALFDKGGDREAVRGVLTSIRGLRPSERGLFKKALTDMAMEGGQSGLHAGHALTNAILASLDE